MQRIAIVNRGEAASRCLRAIKELRAEEGSPLTAVVLYTEPDRGAPFVRQADVVISLGPALRASHGAAPRPVYLDRPRVLAALRATRADAVWPGWGFVAEDARFAELLEQRGIAFLGPRSETLRALADKVEAKRLAEAAGIPVVPWSGGTVDAASLGETAERIGFPAVLKALAGGGGRGIRVVRRRDDLRGAFASSTAEAAHAFGDERVFLEAFLERPRHVEVQIAGDRHGRCLALGLRDCSVQRRHQKILEEAPPPDLDAGVAAALREAALRLAASVRYTGLGTVEFLLDAGGRDFFFLEVNPRLQVEHGLTEALTGIDLVKLQIRLARGEPLPRQAPAERGHAVEARVCAEDPAADFMPAPGKVVLIDVPSGTGLRTDSGVALGNRVPAEFDTLVAKVIAHAPTRAAALARLQSALADFRLVVSGGAINTGFLLQLLAHPELRGGKVDVQWLDRTLPALPPPAFAAQALLVAAILTYLDERATARLNFFAEAATAMPRSIPRSTGQSVDLACRGQSYRLLVLATGDWGYRVRLDDRECVVTLLEQEAHACQLVIGDRRHGVTYGPCESGLRVQVDGHPHVIGRDTGGQVRASAPSVVIAIDVEPGQRVEAGQRLGLLETMKIEIAFNAPAAGTVKTIHVRRNERVAAGAVLMVVQPEAGPSSAAGERVALPAFDDPLQLLFGADGRPDLTASARREVPVRERALRALTASLRRVLLGYDVGRSQEARLLPLLRDPLPADLGHEFLTELAEIRQVLLLFADTEVLFSRQPESAAGGVVGPSNDAWLRLFLRRVAARGAGIPQRFLDLLQRALGHYGIAGLEAGDALERALLRLYAAQAMREPRHRLVTTVLRHLTRIAEAGVELSDDQGLADALGTCMALRGQVPEALADAAADARYAIFEAPQVRRRTESAAAAVEEALRALGDGTGGAFDPDTLAAIADSPAPLFAHIGAWHTDGGRARRDLALQASVLRQYAPLRPRSCASAAGGPTPLARIDFAERGVVLACTAAPGELPAAWDALSRAAAAEQGGAVAEVLLPLRQAATAAALRSWAAPLVAAPAGPLQRVSFCALQPDGRRWHASFERDPRGGWRERGDLMGLHPETARRIDLSRLADFALERLPGSEGIYAFFGRSRSIRDDERIFLLAEVRAAVPGESGTLHEPAFVQTFLEAVRVLRGIRAERDQHRRLHWNRITVFVRPALSLLPDTVDRLAAELAPATRHLGLEKIVVRFELREHGAQRRLVPAELVVDPNTSGKPALSWREPHRDTLRPASDYERRIAQARRRGLVYPYEALRLFTGGAGGCASARFEEFDLAPGAGPPTAASVGGRPPGENRAGIVFGLITTCTAKHPEGMTRVAVLGDPTRDMGALALPECERIVAAIDLAAARGLPVEWISVSAGARIAMDSGTENLDATARVVRRIVTFTQAGGEINVVVAGVNVGAQSYFDALATMLMHTRGILVMTPGAAMVLTGRLALEASGGVSAEDEVAIGGFERTMGPNGQAQYYARDLEEAYDILLRHYRYTYVAPGEERPRRHATADPPDRSITGDTYPDETGEGFHTVGEIFDDATNPGRKKPFAMRPLMRALIDRDGGHLERWSHMAAAETAIVWDAHLGGHPICLIGMESRNLPRLGYRPSDGPDQWTGGTLFPLSSKKVARALNAASGNRAAVILANLSGFDGSPESMRDLQLEYGAEIARAVVNFAGPILFAVVSRYHGGAYVVFSCALNDRLAALALRGSYASVIGGGPAAMVVFAREVQARTDADPRLRAMRQRLRRDGDGDDAAGLRVALERLAAEVALEKQAEIAREFDAIHTVERARAVGSLDAILPPQRLRAELIRRLDSGGT
jgi:acetyl/propionyl-CoA carboxylase alpha subunit/acetyl-CoA carboxylase carboxyltransferase component